MKSTLRTAYLLFLFALGLTNSATATKAKEKQKLCRTGIVTAPHQSTLWLEGFPNNENVEALCEGSIEVLNDGEICITGRVSYAQIAEKVGKPIRAPAALTISLTGHLVVGSPSVVVGVESNFLYDFVTRYTCGGTSYEGGTPAMTDHLLGARCGVITEVCLDASFAKDDIENYVISHDLWMPPAKAQEEKYMDADVIYVSAISVVAEYTRLTDRPGVLGTLTNTFVSTFSSFVAFFPGIVFDYLPVLGAPGLARLFVFGTTSTAKFPQPAISPETLIENVQFDTEWRTLMDAMADDLFTKELVPAYFGLIIRKVSADSSSKGCWKEDIATIDVQAPPSYGPKLDAWIDSAIVPALKEKGGHVGLHMGERVAAGSDILREALDFYNSTSCGVDIDLLPDFPCYHPLCTRSIDLSTFEYPADLYRPAK